MSSEGTICRKNDTSYSSERDLVDCFLQQIMVGSPWGDVRVSTEFNYYRGKTDVIVIDVSGRVIAVEAKLSNWRKALEQAHRNLCFANSSYVLMPKKAAQHALKNSASFTKCNVGICYVDDCLVILQESTLSQPIQPWLSERATNVLTSEC